MYHKQTYAYNVYMFRACVKNYKHGEKKYFFVCVKVEEMHTSAQN
jgi:hypothetical protein